MEATRALDTTEFSGGETNGLCAPRLPNMPRRVVLSMLDAKLGVMLGDGDCGVTSDEELGASCKNTPLALRGELRALLVSLANGARGEGKYSRSECENPASRLGDLSSAANLGPGAHP